VREDVPAPAWSYEDEDQSHTEFRLGMQVRHAQFGVGTVLSVEPYNDDLKITVRFAAVGQKKLLARFAKLEPA
jgi:DNA helicase-2/ATP-dependent DNA helicase PcrA